MEVMKHTRNNVAQHVKKVHQVSWNEYWQQTQDRDPLQMQHLSNLAPLVISKPSMLLFHCLFCSRKVKGRKQQLNKVHHMEEEVYDLHQQNINAGAVIPELNTCKICRRICVDLSQHLKISHKLNIV